VRAGEGLADEVVPFPVVAGPGKQQQVRRRNGAAAGSAGSVRRDGARVFGSVSDYLGRRRVILAALAVTAGACAVFLVAHSVGLLFAARALQGLAVGTAAGALGAALIDLQPEGSGLAPLITTAAPLLGLGAGALGTSALARYGPAPTRLVWWLLLGRPRIPAGPDRPR